MATQRGGAVIALGGNSGYVDTAVAGRTNYAVRPVVEGV